MSRQVEGSSGMFSLFGILWMRAPFQESDTFALIRQELKIWVRVCVDVGLVALNVSWMTPIRSTCLVIRESGQNWIHPLCCKLVSVWKIARLYFVNGVAPRGRSQWSGSSRSSLTFSFVVVLHFGCMRQDVDACVRKTAIVLDEIDCLWFAMLPEICHFVPGNPPLLLSCLSPGGAQRWLYSLLDEAKLRF